MSKKLKELSKLNFWDAIKVMRPLAWEKFDKWLDEYKPDNDWKELFNPMFKETDVARIYSYPKFHDLPAAMQIGIFMQWMADEAGDTAGWLDTMQEIAIEFFKLMDKGLAGKL